MPDEADEDFRIAERGLKLPMLAGQDNLVRQIVRESEHYAVENDAAPLKVGEHIYYRRLDNAADRMTLYRFPVDSLQEYEIAEGCLPNMPPEPDNDLFDSLDK